MAPSSDVIVSSGAASVVATNSSSSSAKKAGTLMKAAATSWFVVAVLGQLMFVAYIAGFYGRAAARGEFEAWNKVLPHGYVPGDTFGNMVLSAHLLFAAFITVGGALQLLPKLRQIAPAFHRWNGRVYVCSALLMAIGGIIMMLTRGTVGDFSQHAALTINGFLIIVCAVMAYRYARARRIDLHRRWALRLFLVVSGVWFFRIGLMFWIVVNQGPAGFDPETFVGPALTFLAFAQYGVPLMVLELYFLAQKSHATSVRIAMAAGLVICTLLTGVGIAAASMIMWLPRLV
jgi:Predicted membrane protein (DUF2306)